MTMRKYIWQLAEWPGLHYDSARLEQPIAEAAHRQGRLLGRLTDADDKIRLDASLAALTADVVKTSEIEGELLDAASVRSSIARHLGVEIGGLTPTDRHVDGVVEMVLDATVNYDQPVTSERLFGWHAALFPTGYSRISRVRVGGWRSDEAGPMEVVSGPYGNRRVHFEAPPAIRLNSETARFLEWFNADAEGSPLIKAGIAHLWFVTLHPFDDGNGRVSRALGDLWLARADQSPRRFYSLSAQIQRDRKAYYAILERTQKGTLDITEWLLWFISALHSALSRAEDTVDTVLSKSRFWRTHAQFDLNSRQIVMLNRLFDGFHGKLTTRKWATITKCSQDTALRDINELVEAGILLRSEASGRSTSYELARDR